MNGSESGILEQRERDIVEKTKEKLEKGLKLLRETADAGELVPAWERILRELRGFDSELFIVTTMGMLKAGKSSLVNLLARSPYASPIGYGEDTTLRPALVMQARAGKPDGEIEVWFENDASENTEARRKILAEVFDYLRDVAPQPSNAYCNSHPLTSEKLSRILCGSDNGNGNELPKEPIIAVVRVPRDEASLLSEKIVVLDTPGLDSMNSKWTESGWYQWLIAESDLLLFLQSSVAPLNKEAGAVLREIKEAKREVPIWLIQNRMEAKHWQTEAAQNAANAAQRETAVSHFEKYGMSRENYTVNLGKMCSAIFEQEKIAGDPESRAEALKEESGFPELEKAIKENLTRNAARLRKRNCARKVCAEYGETEKSLDTFLNMKIKERAENLAKTEQAIEDAYKELYEKIEPTKTSESGRIAKLKGSEICVKNDGFRFKADEYKEKLNQSFPEGSYKVEKLNDFKQECCGNAEKHIRKARLNLKASDVRWKEEGESENAVKKTLRDKLAEDFKNFIRNILDSKPSETRILGADNIERGTVGEDISDLDGETGTCFFPDYSSAGRNKWTLGIMEKARSRDEALKYVDTTKADGITLQGKLEEYFKSEEKKAQEAVAAWANKRLKELCRDFLKKLEQRKDEKLSDIARKREEAETQEKRLSRTLDILRETKKDFADEFGI